MTTSPRVALCVVLGSWGALLVAAGVAGERHAHALSHRLSPTPMSAGIEQHGATALAGIHLDSLYTDDACGHTAPITACGMTMCRPFDRPADQIPPTTAQTGHYCEYDYDYDNYRISDQDTNYANDGYEDDSRYYEVLGEEYSPSVKTSEPAKFTGYTDDVYYDDLTGEYVPYVATPKASPAPETVDDAYYGQYEEYAVPRSEIKSPSVTPYTDDEYYDDLTGEYTPAAAAPQTSQPADISNYSDEGYYDDLTGEFVPYVAPSKTSYASETADDPYYNEYEEIYSPRQEAYNPTVADDNDWDEGATGWYADPQDTDDLDANIYDNNLPNVNTLRTPADLDTPYYGEADPCDDWCGQYEPRVITGSLAELAASPWHTLGQALAIQLNFENDGLPKIELPAPSQVIAHLMSIETMPNLPAWMYGRFAFDQDWHGCNSPYADCEMTPYPASHANLYPGCEFEPSPVSIPETVWTENRIHSTSSFVWDEEYEDYCHADYDCISDADRAINLALQQEVIRLGLIPTMWSAANTWNNYQALWNEIAGDMGEFAYELALAVQGGSSNRSPVSANRPVRVQPNLHLGL